MTDILFDENGEFVKGGELERAARRYDGDFANDDVFVGSDYANEDNYGETVVLIQHTPIEHKPQEIDFVALRRLELAMAYASHTARVGRWLRCEYHVTGDACHCGRNHYSVQTRSELGVDEHCPFTLYGWLVVVGRSSISLEDLVVHFEEGDLGVANVDNPRDELALSMADIEIPGNMPDDEKDKWLKLCLEKGATALNSLRSLDPEVADAVTSLVEKRKRSRLSSASKALYGDAEVLI